MAQLKKKVIEREMFVLMLSITFVRNTYHSNKWTRYDQKWILVFT